MTITAPTASDIRNVLGLDTTSAPDSEISEHIQNGIRETALDICFMRVEQPLTKVSETEWILPDRYIADLNFDGMPDVVVYYYDESNDQVFLEISAIKRDRLYLTESVAVDIIYADYMAFPNRVSQEDFKMLCIYRIAYIYVASEIALLPQTFTHGALRYRADGLERIPAMRYNELREKIIYKVITKQGKGVSLNEINTA